MYIFHCSECDAYILRNIAENRRIECYCGEHMPKLSSEEVLNHLNKNRDKKHEESKKVYRLLKTNNILQSDLDKSKADLLELAKYIKQQITYEHPYCCDEYDYGFTNNHEESCIVLKAEKIIEELESEQQISK